MNCYKKINTLQLRRKQNEKQKKGTIWLFLTTKK